MLQLLIHRPDLAHVFDAPLPPAVDVDARALRAVVAAIRADRSGVATTAGLLEAFRESEHAPLMQALAAQIMDWEDGFNAEEEFAGALERYRTAGASDAIGALLQRGSLARLSAEERERLRGFRREENAPVVRPDEGPACLGNSS